MDHDSDSAVRSINLIAAVLAVAVALSLPTLYFTREYANQAVALETEAEINARIAREVIAANPEMWMFEEVRLGELLARRPVKGYREERRILDTGDNVVAASMETLAPPLLRRSETLLDSGKAVGRIEITRSLRPLLLNTGLVVTLGVALGIAVFTVLKVLPLRVLRKALNALYEEKERAQVTLQSIGDGVITTNLHGEIELINQVAERLTGWSREEARGRRLEEVFRIVDGSTRQPCANPAERALATGQVVGLANHTVLIARDGAERVIADSGAPIHDSTGRVLGVVLVFRDETEKARSEEELFKVRKLESIGILAGGIAHDFNNFLAGILGNLSLAKLTVDPANRASSRIEEAERATLRLKELSSKLLTFSKGGKPMRTLLSVEEVVRDAALLAIMGSNARCDFALAGDLWPIEADGSQVAQVVSNLVINAVQATPGGGTVRICAENVVVAEGEILYVKEGDYVKVEVEDRGIGIPKKNLPRIFDPYFTTKANGNGLGLATSYNIMKNHGGNIFVESAPGKGTTFRFYLPAMRAGVLEKEVTSENSVPRGNGKVLVMDDQTLLLDLAEGMLEHLGYEPSFARDGAEAVEIYIKAQNERKPFCAAVLDLTIPGGLGGKEAAERLLALYPDARLIVSSGYSNDPVMADFARYGFKGVVAKPYRIEELSRALRDVVQAPARHG